MNDLLAAHRALMQVNQSQRLQAPGNARAAALTLGVLREITLLEWLRDHLLAKPLPNKHADVAFALLIGLYQIRHMRTPDHAAVKETVDLARKFKKSWATGLLNATLRRYLRERDAIDALLADTDAAHAHPGWLLRAFRADWPDHVSAITAANNEPGPLTLRVNPNHGSREDYLAALAKADVDATPCDHAGSGIRINDPVVVTELPGFKDGHCTVQDEASQLAAPLLGDVTGARVLDVCAAPGGKTTHLLERGAEVVAVDIDEYRLGQLKDNLTRLHLNCDVMAVDALKLTVTEIGDFDHILLDAPCTGTGVIRRHPDIKLLRHPDDVAKLAAQQRRLIESVWDLLKPGGTLLYTTCSILQAENEQVIHDMLSRHPSATVQPLPASWGIALELGRQQLPTLGAHDGFYYALLNKAAAASNATESGAP